jgi:hypothetical protein
MNKTKLTIGLVIESLFTIWGTAIYLKTNNIGFLLFTLLSLGGIVFFGYKLYKKYNEEEVVEEVVKPVKPVTEFPSIPSTNIPNTPPVVEDPSTAQHGDAGKTTKPKRKYTRRKPRSKKKS